MNPETLTLLQNGATTLVGLMVTDAWKQVRQRAARMLGGREGDAGFESALSRLDESRTEVLVARAEGDTQGLADIEGEWRRRLRRLLASNPAVAEELRSIVEEYAPALPPAQGGDSVRISGSFYHSPVIGQGTQYINTVPLPPRQEGP
ncbi:hypothetical protein [Streptomyces sp. TP-A0874]|uniref:hypothetical protein n=1 Tax=Streptomyces sp. TP-A0874 TaxID=549819 RepID=UPI000853CC30|nr:hypothetical protein [Streptomyces sp. TP-A0874]